MRGPGQTPASLRRIASLSLFATTILALANLPAEELPPLWLLAFTVPGAVLGSWARLARAPWRRALLAILLQAGACYGALVWVGPMTRPAALACTILPPLAFATTRNHDSDPSLALFLSFCVLLVGVILDGLDMRILLAYGAVAFLSLHIATLLQSHRTSNPKRSPSPIRPADAMATSMMMLSCMVAVFAIERTLSCLPSPSRSSNQNHEGGATSGSNRQVGLDDSFILDGQGGILSELSGEQLVRVSRPDNETVAGGLYLRCGFFALPGMDRWRIGQLNLQQQSHADGHVFRRRRSFGIWSGPTRRLTIERFAGAAKFVFLPPNPLHVIGLNGLVVDPVRLWIRPTGPVSEDANATEYTAVYSQVPAPRTGTRTDPRARQLGMTQLPADMELEPFQELLDQWGVSREPMQAMAAIAKGLAGHCRYARSEPLGPYSHTIENFLFADGDRSGYCMHFASSAALMLRLRGIPCRIGVGLYGGSPDSEVDGARMFGSQNAHAWVEVPFEGRGFLIFDPTPPDSRGRAVASDAQPVNASDPNLGIESSLIKPTIRAVTKIIATPWTWAIVLAVVIVLAVLPRRQPRPPARVQPIMAPKARRALQKLIRALAKAGHARRHGQTLERFAEELANQNRLVPEVGTAFTAYQEVRFGGRDFDAQRAHSMEQGLRAAIIMQSEVKRGS